MNEEQKRAQRNEIVSKVISILQTYDYTYGECYFVKCRQMGVVSFCCDMVAQKAIRKMEEMGLEIYHIWFNLSEHCYKISFKYQYHD